MKRLKKILALALAMAMVLAMAIPALATTYGTQNQPHTITITNNGNGAHTYSAYQIFKGNLDADEDTLTDITWGSGVDGNALLAALKNASATDFPAELKSGDDSLFKDCTTAADVAKILATDAFKTAAKLDAFAKIAEANKATASAADVSAAAKGGKAVLNVTGDGYYMVLDTTTNVPEGDTKSKIMLNVVQNVEITAKATQMTPDKEIVGAETNVKAGTAAIGDEVTFQVVIDVPDTTNYKDHFVFQMFDKLPTGLTFKAVDSIAIYKTEKVDSENGNKVSGTPLYTLSTSQYTVTTAAHGTDISNPAAAATQAAFTPYPALGEGETYITRAGGQVIKVVFNNFKTLAETSNNQTTNGVNYIGDKIVVTYKAVVNDDATYGPTSNKNEVEFKYSNDPNHNYTGDDFGPTDPNGKTPKSTTDTYVTALEVYKYETVNGTKTALAGAEFELTGTNILNHVLKTGEDFVKKSDFDAAAAGTYTRVGNDIYYELKDGTWTTTVAGSTVDGRTVNDTQYVDKNVQWVKVKVDDVLTEKTADYKVKAISNDAGLIEFKGLKAGDYVLEETHAPEGYNKLTDKPALKITWEDPSAALAKAEAERTDAEKALVATGGFKLTGADAEKFSFVTSSDGDSIATVRYEVENNKGSVLPSTGGIGTTIFYVVGAILVIGAGVVLITRRRMDA